MKILILFLTLYIIVEINGLTVHNKAAPGEIPYIAQIRKNAVMLGAAVILNENHLLSCDISRQCSEQDPCVAYVGRTDINGGGIEIKIKVIALNPEYLDMAILETTDPIPFSANISAVQLPEDTLENGTQVIISGWGSYYEWGVQDLEFGETVAFYTGPKRDLATEGDHAYACGRADRGLFFFFKYLFDFYGFFFLHYINLPYV